MTLKTYKNCRLCDNELVSIIDLGTTEPANAYIDPKNPHVNDKYPLNVCLCRYCGCVQLKDTVSPELLFKNYKYSSSRVSSLVKHFEEYANSLNISPNAKILEIGSNDGALLQFLKPKCSLAIGVEPADNLAQEANNKGLTTICDFFNKEKAKQILEKYGAFDIIICNNCFAHIDDIKSVVKGIKLLLKHNGYFVFENAYLLDTIKNLYFDQLYHEHIFYHSIKPLKIFLEENYLEIFNVEKNSIQGGTIRVFVKHIGNTRVVKPIVKELIEKEEDANLYSERGYWRFNDTLNLLKTQITNFIITETSKGKTFCAYGAAAKYTTFASFFGISKYIKYVVDDSELKWGLLTTDGTTKIESPEFFKQNPTDYCIVAAWNFFDFIVNKHQWFKGNGKFISCMPEIRIV